MAIILEDAVTLPKLSRFMGKQDAKNDAKFLAKDAQAASAAKLPDSADAGSATRPVYFSGGVPVASAHELNATVPADAVFTDTTYREATSADAGLMSASDYSKLAGINVEGALTNGQNVPTGAAVVSYVAGLGYATAGDLGDAIGTALSATLKWKGAKDTAAELPASGNAVGDTWHVAEDGSEYAWDGIAWQELGPVFDATGYVLASEITECSEADIDGLFADEPEHEE